MAVFEDTNGYVTLGNDHFCDDGFYGKHGLALLFRHVLERDAPLE